MSTLLIPNAVDLGYAIRAGLRVYAAIDTSDWPTGVGFPEGMDSAKDCNWRDATLAIWMDRRLALMGQALCDERMRRRGVRTSFRPRRVPIRSSGLLEWSPGQVGLLSLAMEVRRYRTLQALLDDGEIALLERLWRHIHPEIKVSPTASEHPLRQGFPRDVPDEPVADPAAAGASLLPADLTAGLAS